MTHLPAAERVGIEIVHDLAGKLDRGRIDVTLSLTDRGGSRFIKQPLMQESYAIAIAASHPLADRAEIAAEEIARETMIGRRHCEASVGPSALFSRHNAYIREDSPSLLSGIETLLIDGRA